MVYNLLLGGGAGAANAQQQQFQPRPTFAQRLQAAAANPAFGLGMGLMSAATDRRVSPVGAGMRGMYGAIGLANEQRQMQQRKAMNEQRIAESQARAAEYKAAGERRAQIQAAATRARKVFYDQAVKDGIDDFEQQRLDLLDVAVTSGDPRDYAAAVSLRRPERQILKDITGTQRYVDTGEAVFPGVTPPPAKPDIKTETGLRKEFQSITKPYRATEEAYGRILASAQNPSPAGDAALIFNYMKMLDPGSTVREGEYDRASEFAGIPERIRIMFQKARTGESLTPRMRADILARSRQLYGTAKSAYLNRQQQYRDLAGQYEGVDPSRIAIHTPEYDESDFQSAGGFGLEVGREYTDQETGDRAIYRGGDPNDLSNWEMVK